MSNLIERNLYFLCKNTGSLKEIITYLISTRVITSVESEEISKAVFPWKSVKNSLFGYDVQAITLLVCFKESGSTNFNQFANLYMTISRKLSQKATYDHLTQALLATNQQNIVEVLNSSQRNFEQSEFYKKLEVPAKALTIVDVSEPNFRVNIDAFNFVLGQTGGMPIVVLSINGPTRSGKSFLLNYFLKYLENFGGNRGQCATEELFKWGGGQNRVTVGINLWSKPFFVQTDDGSIVAILLLDVQGLFDKETTYRQNAIIFALSSLFSTYMMYNQQGIVREDVLQNIQCFLNLAENVANDYNTDTSTNALDLPSNLLLLLRDLEIENYEYGLHTFGTKPPNSKENYLRDLFNPPEPPQETTATSQNPDSPGENQRVRDRLNSLSCKIASYLLPYPGSEFVKNKTRIPLDIFEKEAISFVRFIVNTQIRVTRSKSQNVVLTQSQYANKILTGIEAICEKSSKYFLNAKSVEELKNINQHMNALQSARKLYQNALNQFLAMHPHGASEDELNRANATALHEIEKEFQHLEHVRTDYDVQFLQEKDKMIAELYTNAKTQNEQNVRAKTMRDAEERHQKELAAAELEKRRKEAELLAAQISSANAVAAGERERQTREAEHGAALAKLQEEAERDRLRREQELHEANLALAASQSALNEARRSEKKKNWGKRVFGW